MENILSTQFAELCLNTNENIIRLEWKDDVKDEDYRKLWDTLLEAGLKYDVHSLIIDQRNLGDVSMNIRVWFLMDWIPKAKKAMGNKLSVAIIISDRLLNKSGMQYLVKGIKKITSFNIRFVTNEEEGLTWLKEAEPINSAKKAS